MEVYLSEIHPSHRSTFVILAALHGITGERKPKPRSPWLVRAMADLPDNLHFKLPASLELDSYYNARDSRATVVDDPFIVTANAALAETAAKSKTAASGKAPLAPKVVVKRGYDYFAFPRMRESEAKALTRGAGRETVRHILKGARPYCHALEIGDMAYPAIRTWVDKVTGDNGHRYYNKKPCYVHGVAIEGIDFNINKASQMGVKFHPLAMSTNTQTDGELSQIVPSSVGKVTYRRKPVVKPAASEKVMVSSPDIITNHGYMVIGNYIITNFPSHMAWLNSQPVEEVSEEKLLNKWREHIMKGVEDEKRLVEARLEKLTKQAMEEERRLGQLTVLTRAATDNTNAAIKGNLDKLRMIPELASFTPTDFGFTAITNDMMATREITGEERYCGRFEIQVSLKGNVRARNIASPLADYRNPHNTCVGSFGKVFGSALRMFDYYSLVLAIMEYYRMVDEAHDYIFAKIPNSKTAPAVTHLSTWQHIVGDWVEEADSKNRIEADLILSGAFSIMDEDEDEEDED